MRNDESLTNAIDEMRVKIDNCITKLVNARIGHDEQAEGLAMCTMETLMVQTQQLLSYMTEEEPVIVPKPDEEGLKMFIINILKNSRFDKAKPGYTLYDYAIEYMKTGTIPEMPKTLDV